MKFIKFKNEQFKEQLKKIPHNFSVVHDGDNAKSTITIYGIIGDSWWEDSVSASDIDKAITQAGSNDLVIHLNSPGGDAFDGIAIYNRLMNHKSKHNAKITIHVDGWACSAASIIAMAADDLIMGVGAMVMIHQASTIVWGTKVDMLKVAEMLEKLEEGIIDAYMTKANVSREEIRQMVDNETWFTAQEAIDIGFADKVQETSSPNVKTINNAKLDPEQIEQIINTITNKLKNNNSDQSEPQPKQTQARKGFIF